MDYKKILNKRIQSVKPSGIRKFFDIAAQMENVISLGVGEPDFVTPEHIREAAKASMDAGKTAYTANYGLIELRKEIAKYLENRFEVNYDPKDEILVTIGGSEAFDIALRALIEPGDEVLVPDPAYVSYAPLAAIEHAAVKPIVTKAENSFKLMPEELKAAITDKTKALVLAYPNNPTGATMNKAEFEAIAEVLKGTDIIVITDEIYAELVYGAEKFTSFAAIEGMRERTILISGFSKAFAMTGWRLGYMCAPRELLTYIARIHQYAIMCAGTAAQYAGIEALKNGLADTEYMRNEYNKRRQYIYNELRDMGIDCFEPEGAFYIFPDISKYANSSEEFCEDFLQKKHVAIVPGSAFGESGEGHVRISYAASMENIKEAMKRLREYINEK
ncbi:MAG: aminotransferase class I/II-fold pyridoxal phosphate-dependent enzyme [Clostridia bacterium]|nr:aminotransferase class I/II-fold pyridoxal phosphate-dependent enzyme [Clostridia bacterium]